jgi:hypothetical protein
MNYKKLKTLLFLFASVAVEAQSPQLFHLKNSEELLDQASAVKDTQYHMMKFQTDYSPTSWAEFTYTNNPFRLSTGGGFEIYTNSILRMSIDSTGKFRFAGLNFNSNQNRFLVTDSLGNLFYGNPTLAGLTDVSISSPANNDILQYQSSDGKWHNEASGNNFTNTIITSGYSSTVSVGQTIVTFDPSNSISTYTSTLPALPNNNDIVIYRAGGTITSGNVVNVITFLPNSGQGIVDPNPPSFLISGQMYGYQYQSSNSKWYPYLSK